MAADVDLDGPRIIREYEGLEALWTAQPPCQSPGIGEANSLI
jgi:hypothetical protein